MTTIEEALKTAIQYETKVQQVYREAIEKATDPTGKKILTALADEEQGHLDYLNNRLDEWKKTGHVTAEKLETIVPPKEVIDKGIKGLKKEVGEKDISLDVEILQKALAVEAETGNFYKKMVKELPEEGRRLFARFVEIEEGHYDIVQVQLDALQGMGYWFDFQEFDLEAG